MILGPDPHLRERVTAAYRGQFASDPTVLVFAPGRINLIGEHTDYNMGYVLPGAVQYGICFALGVNVQNQHHWLAMDRQEAVVLTGADLGRKHGSWIDFVLGAWIETGKLVPNPPMFNCAFSADLPEGAGLSSSSALTCGVLFGLQALLNLDTPRADIAWMAHQVERGHVGLRGGIMDQYASMLCRAGHLLMLDCRDRSWRHVPFDTEDVCLFLINTNVKHNLTETDYNTRADECAEAVRILRESLPIESLRDVTENHLQEAVTLLDPVLQQRVRFVVKENARVLKTVKSIGDRDWSGVGAMLYESHDGLQHDYAVSCPELDFLVDLARSESWIHGARMMGGGFGGCVLHLAKQSPTESFQAMVIEKYQDRFGFAPTFISVDLSDGARLLS